MSMERSVEREALEDNARVCVRVLKDFEKDFKVRVDRLFEEESVALEKRMKRLDETISPCLEKICMKQVQGWTTEIQKTSLIESSRNMTDSKPVIAEGSDSPHSEQDSSNDNQQPGAGSTCAHAQIVKKCCNSLIQYLTRTVEIGAMMLSRDQLTPQEYEQVFQSNNQYTVNENLLKLILVKPTEVYDCFVEALKTHNQTHLYQLLHTSEYNLDMDHSRHIRSHYIYLIEEINVESMLLDYLWANDIISSMEKEDIKSKEGSFHQKQKLLSLIAMKPADMYEHFLQALDLSGHGHVTKTLTDNSTTVTEDSRKDNIVKSLVEESSRSTTIVMETTMCPDNLINKQKILCLTEKISQLDKKSLTIVSAKILRSKLKNGRYQEDPYLTQLLIGASDLVCLQILQKTEEKKVNELKEVNQRLETDLEKVNSCLTESKQNFEIKKKKVPTATLR